MPSDRLGERKKTCETDNGVEVAKHRIHVREVDADTGVDKHSVFLLIAIVIFFDAATGEDQVDQQLRVFIFG